MDSIEEDLSDGLICPFAGIHFTEAEIRKADIHMEKVRQQCVEEFSKSPLYQARTAKNLDYWKNFSTGQAHLY